MNTCKFVVLFYICEFWCKATPPMQLVLHSWNFEVLGHNKA